MIAASVMPSEAAVLRGDQRRQVARPGHRLDERVRVGPLLVAATPVLVVELLA